MTTDFRKDVLLRKYLEDRCTAAELEELFRGLAAGGESPYRKAMDDLWRVISAEKTMEEAQADRVWKQVIREDAGAAGAAQGGGNSAQKKESQERGGAPGR